jgi:argininosuccinate lyase
MQGKMWGGRFAKKINPDFEQFSKSIDYDYILARYDVFNSLIHVSALKNNAVLTAQEEKRITQALWRLFITIEKGRWKYNGSSEDIHTNIQNQIEEKIGKLGLKLHSLRSRNDQIAFDQQCYCCVQAEKIINSLNKIKKRLLALGKKYKNSSLIGYTHTRRAQVVAASDYFACFASMFDRDCQRIKGYRRRLSIEIGAGALAGNTISRISYRRAIDKWFIQVKQYIPELKKPTVSKNYLIQVSERDFVIEFLQNLALVQMHISRLAEDLIMHSTKEFNYFDLPEDFCTGSSLRPHKKNPDFLELLRGCTGEVYGSSFSLLTLLKSLPLTYNRDMQLDKKSLFPVVNTVYQELKMLEVFLPELRLNSAGIESELKDESIYATEIAEFLVNKGVPFKQAHQVVGKLIRYSEERKQKIIDLSQETLSEFHKDLKKQQIKKIVNHKKAVKAKQK